MERNYLKGDLVFINLYHDPEDAPIYTKHSLFKITRHITFVFIVQSLFDGSDIANPPYAGIKIIQIEYSYGTKFLIPDYFAPCKRGIQVSAE